MKAHILYAEDDESLSFVTRDNLQLSGYRITHCADGKTALELIRQEEFDLCILDVMLPEIDGFTLAEEIRKFNPHVPIIFLTAKSLKEDKLHGLKIGGDDYITKPFSIEELVLKIEIFLRRRTITQPSDRQIYRIGNYSFDYRNLELSTPEKSKTLTQKEADLLRFLVEHKNDVVKRATILEKLWGENDYFLGRSLDVFISRLRKYLKRDPALKIENIHGVGFRLKCD
ncbi:MAG: response regulator transcription factor [Saprospiraceae bacterium]|nr:response regulator transcription factor [Saprospiraceae bacterium]MCB0627008.1 response regulator transcription factor [Saprospiraceae bacterium]MCB0678086.1 response regulator transcription factor [Saprospiraceae bacterium]MCB0679623.1 response regulator transcription factor [Saprospiraceae bacterium]